MKRPRCQLTIYAYRLLADGTRITYVDTKEYCSTQAQANRTVTARKTALGKLYGGYAWIQPTN